MKECGEIEQNKKVLQLGRVFQCRGIRNVYIERLIELNNIKFVLVFALKEAARRMKKSIIREVSLIIFRLQFYCNFTWLQFYCFDRSSERHEVL